MIKRENYEILSDTLLKAAANSDDARRASLNKKSTYLKIIIIFVFPEKRFKQTKNSKDIFFEKKSKFFARYQEPVLGKIKSVK